ncbi:LysR family transcriptional regulator [Staphylococcus gallinarum]|uniref:LysR family transcriptional regulator n=1 Tax=Staphylococcus gallinarum TaxID=1293 RepID=UPI001E2B4110|nr:LysR family transcriptional regulator [Staphylococcus gallinarum]MCD8921372.1 LysR family transcriptional regulator [Staphylococcus gallinarum]MEB6278807.1 LysR family transcriptional regulator [Staphylococcus gallinarum]UEG99517.1 LysR family transcriptional regulator [Staphylococcus gallinarum]
MEWHHFEYFKQLAKLENMSETAKILNVSQSALSRAIKNLEKELGVPLFNRIGRKLKLNQYGIDFLYTTNNIVGEMEIYKNQVAHDTNIESGKLTIGFLHSVGVTYISDFLKAFKKKFPKVRLKLIQNHAKKLLEMLDDGEVDIIVTTVSEITPNTQFEPLLEEELYITLNDTHPLAHHDQISIKALYDEKFILLKQNYVLREQIDELFKHFDFVPEINFEGDETITIAAFISSGLGISILPHLRNIQIANLKQIPISDYVANRKIGLCYKTKNQSVPIINQTRKSLIDYFQSVK